MKNDESDAEKMCELLFIQDFKYNNTPGGMTSVFLTKTCISLFKNLS